MSTLIVVIIVVVIAALLLLALAVRIVWQYEQGVVFRLGRLRGPRAPGLRLIIPFVDVLRKGPAGRGRRSKVPRLAGQRTWRARRPLENPARWFAAGRLCCLAWRTAGRDRQAAAPAGAVEAPGPAA